MNSYLEILYQIWGSFLQYLHKVFQKALFPAPWYAHTNAYLETFARYCLFFYLQDKITSRLCNDNSYLYSSNFLYKQKYHYHGVHDNNIKNWHFLTAYIDLIQTLTGFYCTSKKKVFFH